MIQLLNISLAFGGQQVLNGVTWTIKPGKRIGLIGPNGAGKTTLLRLIAGRHTPDEGEVAIGGGTTLGYLEQDVQETRGEITVLEDALRAFEDVLELQRQEEEITRALAGSDDHESDTYHKWLHQLEQVHAELVTREAHRIQARTEAVLSGLGFDPADFNRPLHTFSGGWRMRVALARLLLKRPDFLLLDEPTNHLDIDSIDWLETYLKSYPGTVVIVSHDRYFLDRMVTTIAELVQGKVTEYTGNYTRYLTERETRRTLQQSAYENQQKQIADTERFVERFRYKATKARQVQSRIKQLEKIDRVEAPPTDEQSISFRFPEPNRSGRVVLELSRFSKRYEGEEGIIQVFSDAGPLVIERGDKIALIGRNGAGKSTLARMLNETEGFDGARTEGYNVERTYFAQHQAEALDPADTILESLRMVARGQSETEIRSILGAFLFSGDDVFKKIGVLSGGEKSRVALARTLLAPANFLILDEPTNHLDMRSVNVLIEALQQYKGTFVVVSHDRHFLDQVVNKVWRAGEGGVRTFIGNYSEYLWQIQQGAAAPTEAAEAEKSEAAGSDNGQSARKTKEQKRLEAEERNRRYRQGNGSKGADPSGLSSQQLRKQYEEVEAAILEKEQQREQVETALADPDLYAHADRYRETMSRYESIQSELQELYARWESLATLLT